MAGKDANAALISNTTPDTSAEVFAARARKPVCR